MPEEEAVLTTRETHADAVTSAHPGCIPFSAIPHSSRLFQHFLFDFPEVSRFYPHQPQVASVAAHARTVAAQYPAARRAKLAGILERQNRAWGASDATLANIARLRSGAVAVISGQQVGLFGGPLFSLLKAASALQLAAELTAQGVDAVPVFWLATEDHDLAEVNHAWLPDGEELRRFTSTSNGDSAAPVGAVRFGPEINRVAAGFAEVLGPGEVSEAVTSSYKEGETFGSAFARLFTRLLSSTGLVLVDPLDPEIHAITAPIMAAAAESADVLDRALLERGKQLRDSGYHEQVKVTPASTLLFCLEDGHRTVIHLAGEDFVIGARRVPRSELLARIQSHPERFSANVLLRPVLQDYLFPTAAYFGGPAEIAYFAQVNVVYERLLGRATPILPRLSATILDGRRQRLLRRYSLSLADLFHGSEQLQERLAAKVLPAGLRQQFASAFEALTSIERELTFSLDELDHTLTDAAARAARKMRYQLNRLSAKAARAELRRSRQLITDSRLILTGLFPEKGLQERTLAGVYFLAAHGPELLQRLVSVAATHCAGHHLLTFD